MSQENTVRILGPNEGKAVTVLGAPLTVKSDGEGGRLFVADHIVPAGYATPPHRHDHEDELFYVLSGEIVLTGDHGDTPAPAGTFAYLPRGSRHGFCNISGRDARMLVVTTAGENFNRFVHAMDRAEAAGPLTPEVVVGLCEAHDIRVG